MDFEKVFKLLIYAFEENSIDFALIGGFALHVAGYTRTTQDIDILIEKKKSLAAKKVMQSFGYKVFFESEDVLSFDSEMSVLGRIDILLAHRKYATAMLSRAKKKDILDGKVKIKVVGPEDLIGLKVQSSSNDPNRYYQDMADIEAVIKANYGALDMELIKEYFNIFKREKDLSQILGRISK